MLQARLRLASLWLSQAGRVLADWTLRTVALLEWSRQRAGGQHTAWYVASAVFITPFIVLAPLNGCLCNALPRRAVLAAASAYTLALVALFAGVQGSWMLCLALTALGSAVYSPARYAMLPAAAQDSRIPLPRVNGWIEMGSASAIVGGLALGWLLAGESASFSARTVAVLVGLNLLTVLAALPAVFPSEVLRPEQPLQAVAGFFRDLARIARVPMAAACVLGLAVFQALILAGAGPIVDLSLEPASRQAGGFVPALVWVSVGTALGCLAAGIPSHPRRNLGLVPLAGLGLLACLLGWVVLAEPGSGALPRTPCLLLGVMAGLVTVPLRAAYQAAVPADARGNGMAVMNSIIYLMMTLLALLMTALVSVAGVTAPRQQLIFLLLLAAAATALAWKILLPQVMELVAEAILWPVYRIHATGPGWGAIPRQGPLLVIANHSAYMDPLWLGKVFPRHLTPMMTSQFYDKPILHWLMVHIVGAIRVPHGSFRRHTPELDQAVAALRRGRSVLIFPEAILRRREERLLRLFGQGVWRILRELPQTPVVVCWIEGGWGSYTSYAGGPPMQNKRRDWWHHVRIAVEKPQVLPAEVLASSRATRRYLMQACLACRHYLGLADVPSGQVEWTSNPGIEKGASARDSDADADERQTE